MFSWRSSRTPFYPVCPGKRSPACRVGKENSRQGVSPGLALVVEDTGNRCWGGKCQKWIQSQMHWWRTSGATPVLTMVEEDAGSCSGLWLAPRHHLCCKKAQRWLEKMSRLSEIGVAGREWQAWESREGMLGCWKSEKKRNSGWKEQRWGEWNGCSYNFLVGLYLFWIFKIN